VESRNHLGADLEDAMTHSERLVDEGRFEEASRQLAEVRHAWPSPDLEGRLVKVRHESALALIERHTSGADPHPIPPEDPFDTPGIPEIHPRDLNAGVLSAALKHRGSLLVRRLFDEATVERLRTDIDMARAAAARWEDTEQVADTAPWYMPFEAEDPEAFGAVERFVARATTSVLTVESPRSLADTIDALRRVGMGNLLEQYFGEWPVISAKKSTLRLVSPQSPTGWHQDGAFLGSDTRTVNVWAALTPCGIEAPGIEVFARPFDEIVETGTGTAQFTWSVSDEKAASLPGPIEIPSFEAGDALLFNQMTLHRTQVDPSMQKDRYAIESWFFAPSTYPVAQVPILF
jgi:hypothetical protein